MVDCLPPDITSHTLDNGRVTRRSRVDQGPKAPVHPADVLSAGASALRAGDDAGRLEAAQVADVDPLVAGALRVVRRQAVRVGAAQYVGEDVARGHLRAVATGDDDVSAGASLRHRRVGRVGL